MGKIEPARPTAETLPRPTALPPPVPPETALESDLVEIWQQALNLQPIGIDDDYFDLGGDSFAAMAVFSVLSEDLAVSLPISTLMYAPTIRELAEKIEETRAAG